jgi:hypothetical protein
MRVSVTYVAKRFGGRELKKKKKKGNRHFNSYSYYSCITCLKVWIIGLCQLLVITEVSEKSAASAFKVEMEIGAAFALAAPVNYPHHQTVSHSRRPQYKS